MKVSIYSPFVFVYDDGTVDVDFFDVYCHTHDRDTGADEFNTEATERHDEIIDAALGDHRNLTPAQRLRQLADYIDAHPVESPVNP